MILAMYVSDERDETTSAMYASDSAMYANDGAIYANDRNHDEDDGSGRRQTAVFINHRATTTSIEPTNVPVHRRIINDS